MNNKLLSFLGLARKAGKLSMGMDASKESMDKGKTELLIFSKDISENSASKALHTANARRVPILILNSTMEEIEWCLGKKIGIIAVNDKGFAKKITELATETKEDDRI